MCDLFGSGDTTSTTQTKLPGYVTDAGKKAVGIGSSIADQSYVANPNQRVADLTPDQLAANSMTRANAGAWQPDYGKATDTLKTFADATWPGQDVNAYMSPYVNSALQPAITEIQRQGGIERAGMDRNMAAADAFGGARHGIVDSESLRNQDNTIANTVATGYNTAYNNAVSAFGADRSARMAAAGGLANAGAQQSQLGYQDAAARGSVGQNLQAFGQENLDVKNQDWQTQQDWQNRGLNAMIAALGGTPHSVNTTTTGPGPSGLGQAVGAGTAIAGTVGMLGGAGSSAGFNWSNLWPF